tara:strand:- start:201 stop:425 length:225 start_codon:yes stop_codon:yes gene_type:complete
LDIEQAAREPAKRDFAEILKVVKFCNDESFGTPADLNSAARISAPGSNLSPSRVRTILESGPGFKMDIFSLFYL